MDLEGERLSGGARQSVPLFLLGSLLVAALASACSDDPTESTEPPDGPAAFYLEAVIETDDTWATTVGTSVGGAPGWEPESSTERTVFRLWFEPPDLWRWEVESESELHGEPSWVSISTGSELVFYNPVGAEKSAVRR